MKQFWLDLKDKIKKFIYRNILCKKNCCDFCKIRFKNRDINARFCSKRCLDLSIQPEHKLIIHYPSYNSQNNLLK